jgi:carbon-monoxide dehydrogenase medium subunit
VIPAEFDYVRAASIEQAIGLLSHDHGSTKLLAGGHSLLPLMKLRLARPTLLVDLRSIRGLDDIARVNDHLSIGPLVTHSTLASSDVVRQAAPLLGETAAHIGDVQVRNAGTIGGSLAHADPGADLPAAMLALDATLHARGPTGTRTIAAADFFVDLLTTRLTADEMLVQIDVPVPATGRAASAYLKFENPASHYALVGVAAHLVFASDGSIATARVGISGVAAKPYRALGVEVMLTGQMPTGRVLAAAAAHAVDGVEVNGDLHASSEYRAVIAQVFTRRALETVRARADVG